jgi:hypothetical protein
MWRFDRAWSRLLPLPVILATVGAAPFASAGGILDRIVYGVDGAESSHGSDPGMWRPESLDGPQGPMQVSAAAAADVGGGNRFDETENRALGRAYLAHMFRRYGSWPDAVAAYNWGPGHLDEWIGGGRPADRFPAAVERYRARVLGSSGLAAWANLRLARLEKLRIEAKRQLAERRRGGRGPDAVELLYAEIMRSTTPGAP